MPKAVKIESSIELTCSLCPKDPKFSDISHLLTHVSSKSHLSHRFKLQIRAQSEPKAKEKLDNFDYWYHDNNLDVMLSERLAAKENKKNTKERMARVSTASTASNTSTNKAPKLEQKSAQEAFVATPVFRAPVPRMHLWPTVNSSNSTPSRDWEENNLYETPTMRRRVPNFAPAEAVTPAGNMLYPLPPSPWKPGGSVGIAEFKEEKENQQVEEKLSESFKLKGVLWPGMDLFDSATPEMKRMRNQRKDSSVLEQMMATSSGVEATEVVYHPDGKVSHSRDIFGPPSIENSPSQDPTPKKRKPRKAAALSDLSVNAPRLRAPNPRKNTVGHTPLKRPSAAPQNRVGPVAHLFMSAPILNPLANFSQRYVPTSDEDEEFRMTVGDTPKKRTFGIFQDAPEISPGRTESSLEDHRFDFSGGRMTGSANEMKSSNFISPTPAAKPPTKRSFGKENGKPGISSAIRPRQPVTAPASHIYPGQVFYDPILNPLYDPAFARSFPTYGQQLSYKEDLEPPHARFHSSLHGQYRPIHPTQRSSGQQSYGVGPSNNGQDMHYEV